jgi:hypothetical protein
MNWSISQVQRQLEWLVKTWINFLKKLQITFLKTLRRCQIDQPWSPHDPGHGLHW